MKVILDGAYGFDNVGDEAMLHTAINLLRNEKPNVEINVSSFQPEKIKSFHGVKGVSHLLPGTLLRNIKNLKFRNILEQLDFIRSSDVLLFAGGSILHDKKGLRDIIVIFYKVLLFRVFGKKVVFWGVAHDQMKSIVAKLLFKCVVSMASLIVFRDKMSADLVAQSMGPSKYVDSGVDILFGLLPALSPLANTDQYKKAESPCRIGLSLRPYPPNIGFDLEALDEALCEQIAKYVEVVSKKIGKPLVIVPLIFSEGDAARNDKEIISRVELKLKGFEFEWSSLDVSACNNAGFGNMLNEYCENISGLDFVIGERFHSLVLSQILAVPYISISYDKKIDELVKLVEMESYSLNLLESIKNNSIGSELVVMTESLLLNRPKLIQNMAKNNDALMLMSKEDQLSVFSALS